MNTEGRRISESCVRENRMHSLMQGKVGKDFNFPTDLLYEARRFFAVAQNDKYGDILIWNGSKAFCCKPCHPEGVKRPKDL